MNSGDRIFGAGMDSREENRVLQCNILRSEIDAAKLWEQGHWRCLQCKPGAHPLCRRKDKSINGTRPRRIERTEAEAVSEDGHTESDAERKNSVIRKGVKPKRQKSLQSQHKKKDV